MRKTHLVGAWPGRSAPHAISTALDRIGPYLLRMTDGETGERSMWVAPTIEWLRVNPQVEMVRDGDYADYDRAPQYRVKEGQRLNPTRLHLGYHAAFVENFPVFKYLRDRSGRPEIRFQIGMPSPLDLTFVCFGMDAAMADPSLTEAWTEATQEQMRLITADADEPVVFQLETVASLVAVAGTPDEAKPAVAEQMAGLLHRTVAGAPEGAHFGAHLCLGDMNHKALGEMTDARPLVLLANALATGFPSGRTLDYIHAPFAAADKPGSFDESWYEPLEDLELAADVRFVAGFIHESIPTDDHRRLLQIIERFSRREVDVAAACGLGRRPDPNQAWDAMDKAAALIEGS
jgi:hypothetical protein